MPLQSPDRRQQRPTSIETEERHALTLLDDGRVQLSSEFFVRNVFDAEDLRQRLAANAKNTVRRDGKTLYLTTATPSSPPELRKLFIDLGIASKLPGR